MAQQSKIKLRTEKDNENENLKGGNKLKKIIKIIKQKKA